MACACGIGVEALHSFMVLRACLPLRLGSRRPLHCIAVLALGHAALAWAVRAVGDCEHSRWQRTEYSEELICFWREGTSFETLSPKP